MTDPPATCRPLDHAVIVAVPAVGGKAVLTPDEAVALAAELRRAAKAARAYRPVVSDIARRAGIRGGAHRKRKP